MNAVDRALQQKVDEAKELARQQEAAKQSAIATEMGATLGRLDKLCQNEDVQWFLTTHVAPIVEQAQKDALDVTKSASDRNDAAHQHHIGHRLLHLLEEETKRVRNSVIAAQKKA